MFENITLAQVVQAFEIIAAIVAGIAVYFAVRTFNAGNIKRQFDLSKIVQDDLTNFTKELAAVNNKDNEAKKLLFERLFNSLEWLGFLINEKQITNHKIIQYFKKLVMQYHDNTFLITDYITDEQRSDPEEYKEFKQLYNDYKNCKYD